MIEIEKAGGTPTHDQDSHPGISDVAGMTKQATDLSATGETGSANVDKLTSINRTNHARDRAARLMRRMARKRRGEL